MSAFQNSPTEMPTVYAESNIASSQVPSASQISARPSSTTPLVITPPHQNRIEPTLAPLMTAPHIFGATDTASRICGYVSTSILICFPVAIHYACYLRQNCTPSFYNYSSAGLAGSIISSVILIGFIGLVFWSYYRVTKTQPGPVPTFLRTTFFEETVKRATVLYCREKEFRLLTELQQKTDAERNTGLLSPNEIVNDSPFPKPLRLFQFNPTAPCIHLHDLSLKSERRIDWEDPFSDVYRKVINPQYYELQKRQQEAQGFESSPTAPRPISYAQLLQAAFVPVSSREPTHYYSFDLKTTNYTNIVGTQPCHKCTEVYSMENSRLVSLLEKGEEKQGYLNKGGQIGDRGQVPLVGGNNAAREGTVDDDDSNSQPAVCQYDPNPTPAAASPSPRSSGPPYAGSIVKWGDIHHCSTCHQCVLALDHHCPWIGQCVGRSNHKFFIQFLFFTSMAALISLVSMAKDIFTGSGNIGIALGITSTDNSQTNACTWLMMVAFLIDGLFFLMLFPFFWSSLENAMTGDTKLEQMIRRRNESTQRARDAIHQGSESNPSATNHPGSSSVNNHMVFDTETEFKRLLLTQYPHAHVSSSMPSVVSSSHLHSAVVRINEEELWEETYFDETDPDYDVGSWRYNLSNLFGPSRLQPYGRLSWLLPTHPVLDTRRDYLLWRVNLSSGVVARLSAK